MRTLTLIQSYSSTSHKLYKHLIKFISQVCYVQFGQKNDMADVIKALKQSPLDFWQNKIYRAVIHLFKRKCLYTLYLSRLEAYPVLKRSSLWTFRLAYVKKQRLQIVVREIGRGGGVVYKSRLKMCNKF